MNKDQMRSDFDFYTKRREQYLAARTNKLRRLVDLYLNPYIKSYANPYIILADVLEEFGQLYILPVLKELFPNRVESVVDWGAGTGWLGRALSHTVVAVDRQTLLFTSSVGTFHQLDLEQIGEETAERIEVLSTDTELSAVCELLHCINERARLQLLEHIRSDKLLVIEQTPEGRIGAIAEQQIALASGQPLLTGGELSAVLSQTLWEVIEQRQVYHYVIWIARRLG
jgi:hypothetical protein